MYISFDGGKHWQTFQLNLPQIPVTELKVHQKDLILSTQGRSFWILDDLTPLHQLSKDTVESNHLFRPRDTYRMDMAHKRNPDSPCGDNPPNGALIFYSFPKAPEDEVTLQIFNPDGKLIHTYFSERKPYSHLICC